MAGLYDDVRGGEVKGTMNPWSYPRRAMGSNVYGGSAGGAGYYGSSAGGGTAMRNPWGAATGMTGAQQGYSMGGQVPQGGQMGQEQGANPWTQSQSWAAQNPQKPAYDLNAAKRMAYLKGNVGGKGNAEYDYLNSLKGQAPGFQQADNPPGWNETGQVIDPITKRVTHGLTKEQFIARSDPNYSANRMNTLFQQLPQYQQYISQLGGRPGQPDNNERWQTFLARVMAGSDPMAVMNSERFWSGI